MSPSLKSHWQIALRESGLGLSLVGVGVILSLHAKADGSGVWPSMEDEADRIGCSRDTLAKYRAALVTLGWLTFVAKVVPNVRGIEYRLTIPEVSADSLGTHPDAMSADISPMSAEISPMSAETVGMSMAVEHGTKNMTLEEPAARDRLTPEQEGQEQYDRNVATQARFQAAAAKTRAKTRELMASAPSFD